ncbi:MAG: hypothetical protein LBR86_02270, partial [Tannerella sp.]|nr:hypothetical protein [Tannerella sp.]
MYTTFNISRATGTARLQSRNMAAGRVALACKTGIWPGGGLRSSAKPEYGRGQSCARLQSWNMAAGRV